MKLKNCKCICHCGVRSGGFCDMSGKINICSHCKPEPKCKHDHLWVGSETVKESDYCFRCGKDANE